MKKIIFLIFIYLLIFNLVYCSNNGAVVGNYEIKDNILLINNKVKINLYDPIEKILKILGGQYSEDFMPGYKEYNLNDYPLSFLINDTTNKIETILILFYKNKDKESNKLINEIIITDFKLNNNTNFNETKALLNKKNVEYELKELTSYYNFSIKNYKILSIKYLKKDLNSPYSIEVLIK